MLLLALLGLAFSSQALAQPSPARLASPSSPTSSTPGQRLPGALDDAAEREHLDTFGIDVSKLPLPLQKQLLESLPGSRGSETSRTASFAAPPAPAQSDYLADPRQSSDAREPARRPERPFSALERIYAENYGSRQAQDVRQFGYSLFDSVAADPSLYAVPDPDYLLGPGDELRVRLWGAEFDAGHKAVIQPDGTASIPTLGVVNLAGIRFGDAEDLLRAEAEKYVQGVNVSVSLNRVRSVEVYVVGDVTSPGQRLVPGFTTILGALAAAGGVNPTGSLRHISLIRDGNLLTKLDLYDLLLHGNGSADEILQSKDIVFVPRIGPTVAIVGAVIQPGVFELSGERTIAEAVALAGGRLPQALSGKVAVRRFVDGKSFKVLDVDLAKEGGTRLMEGDLIDIELVSPDFPNAVTLEGHVFYPGPVSYRPGLKLSDVVGDPSSVRPGAITDYAILYRYDRATTRYESIRFPLRDVQVKRYDLALEPHDRIQVLSMEQFGMRETVTVRGPVWKPGTYRHVDGMRTGELLALAGGLRSAEAYTEAAYIYRYDPSGVRYAVEQLNLREALAGVGDPALLPGDILEILPLKNFLPDEAVTISGAVHQEGKYHFHSGMRLGDLVTMAGGLAFGSSPGKVVLSRKVLAGDVAQLKQVYLDLASDSGYELAPFDYIVIPEIKDARKIKTVSIEGQVRFPGSYTIRDGQRISDLIELAGGFLPEAYYFGAKYTSANAYEIQKKSIDRLIADLEVQANLVVNEQAQQAVTAEDASLLQASRAAITAFVSRLRGIEPEGRVSVHLSELGTFRGSHYDFEVDDGDKLVVPKTPNFVAVVGSVYTPNALLHDPGKDVEFYLEKSGGVTKTADEDYLYVLRANGEVISRAQGSNSFYNYQPMPGDTIVVPEDLERVPYMRLVRDISDIMFKIATTAGIALAVI